jgi:hypothetical protein
LLDPHGCFWFRLPFGFLAAVVGRARTTGYGLAFEELVQRLRATEEWTYVEREIDIRLAR